MKTSTLIINGSNIPTFLALSDQEQRTGLMYKKELPPSMSFVYDYPKINKFWMHNTPRALDIVFCNDGKIIHIAKGEPFSTSLIGPDSPSDLVVEFPYGTCRNLDIKIGDPVDLPEMRKNALLQRRYY